MEYKIAITFYIAGVWFYRYMSMSIKLYRKNTYSFKLLRLLFAYIAIHDQDTKIASYLTNT